MKITPFFETGDTEVIIRLIKENDGISFLPAFAVEKDLKEGSLKEVHVSDFEMTMYRQILYHKDKWVTDEMKLLENLIKDNIL